MAQVTGNANRAYRVVGLKELLRATDAMGKDTKRLVRAKLREAAEPIRQDASHLFAKYDEKSASKYGISVRRTGFVSVEQRLRRSATVDRRRPKFGSLQMEKALLPAVADNAALVEERVGVAVSMACMKFNRGF